MMWPRNPIFNTWGDEIGAIAELRDAAGEDVARTDASWQSGSRRSCKSGIYFGEIFDARAEGDGDQRRRGARRLRQGRRCSRTRSTACANSSRCRWPHRFTDAEGRTVYDFGQNSGGYVAFSVERRSRAPRSSSSMPRCSTRTANSTTRNYPDRRRAYRVRAEGRRRRKSYRPTFTFFGFRYARVDDRRRGQTRSIVSMPISSVTEVRPAPSPPAIRWSTGWCSITIWSQRANFIEVPTDCPQRDERLGWTGDAQVFAAHRLLPRREPWLLRKWMRDLMADQRDDGAVPHVVARSDSRNHEDYPGFYGSTGWGDAIGIMPWRSIMHYGDREILDEALPAMVKWIDFVWSISDGPIVWPPRALGRARLLLRRLAAAARAIPPKPLPTIGDDAAATIYLYHLVDPDRAHRPGRRRCGDRRGAWRARRGEVKAAFASEFITASGRLAYDDQTSYALAFLHDLIPAEHLRSGQGLLQGDHRRARWPHRHRLHRHAGAAAGAGEDRRTGARRRRYSSRRTSRAGSTRSRRARRRSGSAGTPSARTARSTIRR